MDQDPSQSLHPNPQGHGDLTFIQKTHKYPNTKLRLPDEATAILKNFFTSTSRYPTADQKEQLVAQIKTFPGSHEYDFRKVSAWFAGQRKKYPKEGGPPGKQSSPATKRTRGRPKKMGSEMILFPSLTKARIAKLQVLLAETPHPLPEVVAIWAPRIGAAVKDVETWIRLKEVQLNGGSAREGENRGQTTEGEEDEDAEDEDELYMDVDTSPQATQQPTGPASHLPTPSDSTSPEPSPHLNPHTDSNPTGATTLSTPVSASASPVSLTTPHTFFTHPHFPGISCSGSYFPPAPPRSQGFSAATYPLVPTPVSAMGERIKVESPVIPNFPANVGVGGGAPRGGGGVVVPPPRPKSLSLPKVPTTSRSGSGAGAGMGMDVDHPPPPGPPVPSPTHAMPTPAPPSALKLKTISNQIRQILASNPYPVPVASFSHSSPSDPTFGTTFHAQNTAQNQNYSRSATHAHSQNATPTPQNTIPTTPPAPTSAAEFIAYFLPYEGRMTEFLGAIERGKYAEFGFLPSEVPYPGVGGGGNGGTEEGEHMEEIEEGEIV